ncbi:MarR family transcriptional regulator [Phytomonospora sp. NPDC050363]|uniref:MarR family winged helix-turn-helix transcriptional regulator n=1 Tax=Phytomonospora sp. NPDC050363 TaxID=3155642 RepID=UPI0033F40463
MTAGPGDSPGFLLWHATLRWQRDIAAALAPHDLTHVQFVLLATTWWLHGRGERPNQLRLARAAGTDVKMTSQVVRRLEAKGLLTRVADEADTRMKRPELTEAGAELTPRVVEVVEAVDRRFFAEAGDHAGLLRLLRGLAGTDDPPHRT